MATPRQGDGRFLTKEIAKLLYIDNPVNRTNLIRYKLPLHPQDVFQDNEVVALVAGFETGPSVNWDQLQRTLVKVIPHVNDTKAGAEVFDFFSSLINLRTEWLWSAVQIENCNAFNEVMSYVDPFYTDLTEPNPLRSAMQAEINEQHTVAATKAADLETLKRSDGMWKYSGMLWQMVEQISDRQKKLQAFSATQKKALEEVQREMESLRVRNERILQRQLGSSQLSDDMTESNVQAILSYMQAMAKVGTLETLVKDSSSK